MSVPVSLSYRECWSEVVVVVVVVALVVWIVLVTLGFVNVSAVPVDNGRGFACKFVAVAVFCVTVVVVAVVVVVLLRGVLTIIRNILLCVRCIFNPSSFVSVHIL